MRITLGGEARELKYTIKSMRMLEQATGKGFGNLLSNGAGIDTIVLLTWAGLLHENKRLSQDTVEAWLESYLDEGGTLEALGILLTGTLEQTKWLVPNAQTEATMIQ